MFLRPSSLVFTHTAARPQGRACTACRLRSRSGRPTAAAPMTAPAQAPATVNLRVLLEEMIERDASDLHITAGERAEAARRRRHHELEHRVRAVRRRTRCSSPTRCSPRTRRSGSRWRTSSTSRSASRTSRASAATASSSAAASRWSSGRSRSTIKTFEELGLPAGDREDGGEAARPRARHRPDRLGQVDDARRDDRQDQPRAQGPHHHGRRPDRVHPPAPGLHRQPARGRHRHEVASRTRSSTRCVRIPTSS